MFRGSDYACVKRNFSRGRDLPRNAVFSPRAHLCARVVLPVGSRSDLGVYAVGAGDPGAPSPTAKATRLVVRPRTSPTAKTPGQVVSTVRGSRSVRGQRSDLAAEDEPLGVHGDARRQPVGPRLRSDEDDHGRAIEVAGSSVLEVSEPHFRNGIAPFDGVHLDVADDLDFRVLLDPAGEVVGHVLAQVAAAEQERGPGGVLGEEHHRLAGRVAAADHGGPAASPRHERASAEVRE